MPPAWPAAPARTGSVDGLRLLTDLISWLFVMDDACDEDGLGADPVRLGPAISTLLDVPGPVRRPGRRTARRRAAG